jgi:hypothetical protein
LAMNAAVQKSAMIDELNGTDMNDALTGIAVDFECR